MKILMVKFSPIEYNDSSNIRTMALVKGLQDIGCVVDYLTIPAQNSLNDIVKGYGKLNVVRTTTYSLYNSVVKPRGRLKEQLLSWSRRIFHALSLYDYSYSIAKRVDISILPNRSYDIIISSSDPKTSHIAVKQLIRQGLKYGKWIQYWGDPLTLDITNKSVYPKWLISREERKILSGADRVVYVSPITLDEQKRLFPTLASKMHFLPIPYMEEKIYFSPMNDNFTIGYFGDYFSNVRNLIPLYNACRDLGQRVRLNIVGESDIKLQETEEIKIYPRGDITRFERFTDLQVCVLNRKGSQIPGKIYHSAATNKPVLVILDGNMGESIKEYLDTFGRFTICDNEECSIKKAILSVLSSNAIYHPSPEFAPNRIAHDILGLVEDQ